MVCTRKLRDQWGFVSGNLTKQQRQEAPKEAILGAHALQAGPSQRSLPEPRPRHQCRCSCTNGVLQDHPYAEQPLSDLDWYIYAVPCNLGLTSPLLLILITSGDAMFMLMIVSSGWQHIYCWSLYPWRGVSRWLLASLASLSTRFTGMFLHCNCIVRQIYPLWRTSLSLLFGLVVPMWRHCTQITRFFSSFSYSADLKRLIPRVTKEMGTSEDII